MCESVFVNLVMAGVGRYLEGGDVVSLWGECVDFNVRVAYVGIHVRACGGGDVLG